MAGTSRHQEVQALPGARLHIRNVLLARGKHPQEVSYSRSSSMLSVAVNAVLERRAAGSFIPSKNHHWVGSRTVGFVTLHPASNPLYAIELINTVKIEGRLLVAVPTDTRTNPPAKASRWR